MHAHGNDGAGRNDTVSYNKIIVPISESEEEALRQAASWSCRRPKDHARYIILKSLGLVTDDAVSLSNVNALADSILALDGVQQCELAAALVRISPRLADELATTIGDALRADEIATRLSLHPAMQQDVGVELTAGGGC